MITPFRVSFIGGSVEDESCEFSSVDVGSSFEVRSAETEFSVVGCMGSAASSHVANRNWSTHTNIGNYTFLRLATKS